MSLNWLSKQQRSTVMNYYDNNHNEFTGYEDITYDLTDRERLELFEAYDDDDDDDDCHHSYFYADTDSDT